MFRLIAIFILFTCFAASSDVTDKNKPSVLYFGATWCGPCKKMKALFEDKDVKKKLQKVNFAKYDVDKTEEDTKYKITSVPTIIVINNNKISKHIGLKSKAELLKIIP